MSGATGVVERRGVWHAVNVSYQMSRRKMLPEFFVQVSMCTNEDTKFKAHRMELR